ncbi:Uncharacterized mitochondrial protein AtMg00810 [Linum grandiflorum]
MSTWLNFQDETLGKPINEKFYRGMISSLLYLTASRPDIAYRVGVCARFQSKPHESDLKAVKQIFRYLAGTIDMRLWYSAEGSLDLLAYSDSDFAGSTIDRKSTSGTCQFLGNSLVF